jgi:hypothetical protein
MSGRSGKLLSAVAINFLQRLLHAVEDENNLLEGYWVFKGTLFSK